MFYRLFKIDNDDWELRNSFEEQVDYLIEIYDETDIIKENFHVHLDTISKFAKSVKDVKLIKGDILSNPSENIKVTPSFLAISSFTKVTSISLIKKQDNFNLWYSIDNNLCKRKILLKSLLSNFEITSIIMRIGVFKLNEFENELQSKKLYPKKLPFHNLLSPTSYV